jgi:hypothetical protein
MGYHYRGLITLCALEVIQGQYQVIHSARKRRGIKGDYYCLISTQKLASASVYTHTGG